MITIEGKSVFGGVSIGKLMFYKRNEKVIRRTHVDDVDAEWKRFEEAKNTAIDQLKVLYDKAIEDVGEANAMIFEIHQMMLDDLDYLESIEGIIRTQSVNAEYAVSTTADNFAQMFASMDDAYMQGRAADVKDVSERVLDILCGVSNGTREMTEPCIVAADDLAPSETVQLDKEKVLGFATMYGSSEWEKLLIRNMTERWLSLMDLQEHSMWIQMKRHLQRCGRSVRKTLSRKNF